MARFLVYTSPARGHLYPLVPTLLELRRRGHLVHVRTLASEVEALRAAGLDARAIAPEIESVRLADWAAPTPEEGLAGVLALSVTVPSGRSPTFKAPSFKSSQMYS